jgi:hypothetical protein
MASEPESRRPLPLGVWLLTAVLGLAAVGLSAVGWRQWGVQNPLAAAEDKAEAEAKKQDDQAKQQESDPRVEPLVVLPGEAKAESQAVKPGHWATGTERMRAIYQDFVGESATSVVNGRGEAYPVDGTPVVLESTRPVTLAKGQPKEIATTFLAPQAAQAIEVRSELTERGFGRSLRTQVPVARIPSYQYYFVVLAKEPSRYALVKTLDLVNVPWDGETEEDDTDDPLHYRVVSLAVDRVIPLPDNPLTWSSIAYLLWDNVDPKLFTPEQARALVDWLHWGGQLVVSGPDSLDLLNGSFLEPYLPATSGGSRLIAADDLGELNRNWTIRSPRGGQPLAPKTAWSGIELVQPPDQQKLDVLGQSTGGLIVERRVGRGRIVVSAMQLAERELVNWKGGFESLFNGGILRRPRREYRPGYYGELTLAWADPQLMNRRLDARLTTGLRYFARDLGIDTNYRYVDVSGSAAGASPNQSPIRELRPPEQAGGIGAWNDFSATASAAREALVEAAGVEVPDTSFVVICLTMYLVALVPLNWLVFNAIGRVEWAWIAAPVIAVLGTWAIVDRARLDIGFVRAQTEIGVLELQPNYDRGLLARYTALYTSLSTTYDLEFENLSTVAAPFSTNDNPPEPSIAEDGAVYRYERFDAVRLAGVFVPSNTTNMVHSEQMLPLTGAIRLDRSVSQGRQQIENRSELTLHSVAIVERTASAKETSTADAMPPGLRGLWIGELRPGESRPASFALPIAVGQDESPFAEERAAEERLQNVPRLNLEPLFRLALDVNSFEPGERRLVARVDEVLAGETVSPAASQVRGAVLVVAHLDYGPAPEPLPDLNTRQDVAKHEESGFGSQDSGGG